MTTQAPLMVTASGMRGIAGESLTREVIGRYLGAFASLLRKKTETPRVVVGRDGRKGGDEILRFAIEGLREAGCDVVNLDVATTVDTVHISDTTLPRGLIVNLGIEISF